MLILFIIKSLSTIKFISKWCLMKVNLKVINDIC